jgi:phosphatidylglycerophosphatase A
MDRIVLFLAEGLLVGRIPFMPGTFGSALGVLWVALLLEGRNPWIYSVGCLLSILGSVWLGGKAERILRQTDPGCVVLDEIVAMPVCFAGWLALRAWQSGQLPTPESLCSDNGGWWTLGIFLGFRFFDITKPWPVRRSQVLPGGWGVTIDDLLAALYVNLGVLAAWALVPATAR